MGEYVKGDIEFLCKIAPPDISVITGINEAHLERYKTLENAISTKFEIATFGSSNNLIYLNYDDKLIRENYQKYNLSKIKWFSSKQDSNISILQPFNVFFDENLPGITFSLKNERLSIDKVKLNFLSDYIIGQISVALDIGITLGMTETELKLGISKLKPTPHRLEPKIVKQNILLIDDSYNGNSNGVFEAIRVLSKFNNRRKIYVTPGLAETSFMSEEIHISIGEKLAQVADIVILIKNSVSHFIEKGLLAFNFDKNKIIYLNFNDNLWVNLFQIIKEGDVVLIQNDWSDNYF